MTDPQPCRVIGVLDDGAASLSATALAFLRRADWVIGGARPLALLDGDIAPHAIRPESPAWSAWRVSTRLRPARLAS